MDRILGAHRRRSGEVARKRLKLLLVTDKTGCSPELLEMLKSDMCHVISKYLEVDSGKMEVGIRKTSVCGSEDTIPALYAYIPIYSLIYKGMLS